MSRPAAAACAFALCALAAAGSGCGLVYRSDPRPPQLAAQASYEDQYAEAAYKRKKEQAAQKAAGTQQGVQTPVTSPSASATSGAQATAHASPSAPEAPGAYLPETYCLRISAGPVIAQQPARALRGPSDRFLSLHVHSLRSFERAMEAAQVLALRQGRDAFVVRVDLPGSGRWYRVFVGRFEDRQEARRFFSNIAGASEVLELTLACGQ